MVTRTKHSSFLHYLLLLGVLYLCVGCDSKRESKKSQKIDVSNSIDTLQNHVKLPALKNVHWIMRPIGVQSPLSMGPQDFELIVYSPEIPSMTRDYIEKKLAINEANSESAAIDSSVAKALGIDVHSLEKIDEMYIIKGKVYDAKPILINMTSGIVVLSNFGLFVIGGTS